MHKQFPWLAILWIGIWMFMLLIVLIQLGPGQVQMTFGGSQRHAVRIVSDRYRATATTEEVKPGIGPGLQKLCSPIISRIVLRQLPFHLFCNLALDAGSISRRGIRI